MQNSNSDKDCLQTQQNEQWGYYCFSFLREKCFFKKYLTIINKAVINIYVKDDRVHPDTLSILLWHSLVKYNSEIGLYN